MFIPSLIPRLIPLLIPPGTLDYHTEMVYTVIHCFKMKHLFHEHCFRMKHSSKDNCFILKHHHRDHCFILKHRAHQIIPAIVDSSWCTHSHPGVLITSPGTHGEFGCVLGAGIGKVYSHTGSRLLLGQTIILSSQIVILPIQTMNLCLQMVNLRSPHSFIILCNTDEHG